MVLLLWAVRDQNLLIDLILFLSQMGRQPPAVILPRNLAKGLNP